MKNLSKIFGIIAILAVIMISLGSCSTNAIMRMTMENLNLNQIQFTDFGAFDNSLPADQQAELRFMFMNIRSFNGRQVSWGDRANNIGYVLVPAGENTMIFDYITETTEQDMRFSARGGNQNWTITTRTTTRSRNNISLNANMLPSHKYVLQGVEHGGEFIYDLYDITYGPSEIYGDVIPNAPIESVIPTIFEGIWASSTGDTFQFVGNSWIQTILNPHTQIRGTFESSDETISMFATGIYAENLGGWLNNLPKSVHYYNYVIDGDSLSLELPFAIPIIVYTKQ